MPKAMGSSHSMQRDVGVCPRDKLFQIAASRPASPSPEPPRGQSPSPPSALPFRWSRDNRRARSSCALLPANCSKGGEELLPRSGCTDNESTVRPIWIETVLPCSSKRGFFMATSVPNFELLSSSTKCPLWKRIIAWQREIETSAMRTSLSWPRPSLRTFSANEITCNPRLACCCESRTMFSRTMKGGCVRGTSTSGARSWPTLT
mmetsp:Transcript_58795/g.136816  ORF Transcript_58795/g.136816 Transcript_58795/m.136816 type:complete len:205 (+) Transcript_58795:72-686(+)